MDYAPLGERNIQSYDFPNGILYFQACISGLAAVSTSKRGHRQHNVLCSQRSATASKPASRLLFDIKVSMPFEVDPNAPTCPALPVTTRSTRQLMC
eukprot:6202049-Pleurochrysis_carterae.AAC.4